MSDSLPAPVGVLVRALVVACFVGGGVLALLGGRLVLAGVAYLAGYTALAGAALVQGQRRRGAGLSLSGLGWMALAVGVALGSELPLLGAGVALLAVGTGLLVLPWVGNRRETAVD
jgi:hypothetical protein